MGVKAYRKKWTETGYPLLDHFNEEVYLVLDASGRWCFREVLSVPDDADTPWMVYGFLFEYERESEFFACLPPPSPKKRDTAGGGTPALSLFGENVWRSEQDNEDPLINITISYFSSM